MSRKSFPLVILLPPSEGKAEGGSAPKWKATSGDFGKAFGTYRSQIATALEELGGGDAKLLGVGGKHLARAQEINTSIIGAPTMAAHERYTGVVWDHLSPTTMSVKVRARATESIIVLSGLLGLVGFDDQIPDYKLKMGASFAPIGKLSTWWREPLSKVLNARLARHHVIDLLPNEHRQHRVRPAPGVPLPLAHQSPQSVLRIFPLALQERVSIHHRRTSHVSQ